MSTPAEVQALLRFLSQDAKVPLANAMGKIGALKEAKLTSPELISKSDTASIKKIFDDEKIAKQVLQAAKRSSKKRAAGDGASDSPSKKRKSSPPTGQSQNPADIEASLALPTYEGTEEELSKVVVNTNRAPLVLAFAVVLLKYTMPHQPLSSRLSLAQAVVSANSRSKAISIGLETGSSAEEEGWGQGQPTIKVMGRDIRGLKRWGYDWQQTKRESSEGQSGPEDKSQESHGSINEPALWGLDLEALRSLNAKPTPDARRDPSKLPVFTPESARSYLLKSFNRVEEAESGDIKTKGPVKKKSASAIIQDREENAAKLLAAIDLLFSSYEDHISNSELDRRAWGWYVQVRPDVATGVAGWGGKANVSLARILSLKRKEQKG